MRDVTISVRLPAWVAHPLALLANSQGHTSADTFLRDVAFQLASGEGYADPMLCRMAELRAEADEEASENAREVFDLLRRAA